MSSFIDTTDLHFPKQELEKVLSPSGFRTRSISPVRSLSADIFRDSPSRPSEPVTPPRTAPVSLFDSSPQQSSPVYSSHQSHSPPSNGLFDDAAQSRLNKSRRPRPSSALPLSSPPFSLFDDAAQAKIQTISGYGSPGKNTQHPATAASFPTALIVDNTVKPVVVPTAQKPPLPPPAPIHPSSPIRQLSAPTAVRPLEHDGASARSRSRNSSEPSLTGLNVCCCLLVCLSLIQPPSILVKKDAHGNSLKNRVVEAKRTVSFDAAVVLPEASPSHDDKPSSNHRCKPCFIPPESKTDRTLDQILMLAREMYVYVGFS
jgi:hypothetical protein